MLKRWFAMILSAALITLGLGFRPASAQNIHAAAERARAVVARVGVGEKARVEVRLPDQTKVKGYVSEASADSFTVTEAKTGAARTFAYSEVTEVKKRGGLSTTTKALIWGGVAAGAVITLYVVRGAFCDGLCV